MWLIVQQPESDDRVLATAEGHSVREFVEKAFARVDKPAWKGGMGNAVSNRAAWANQGPGHVLSNAG